MIVRHRRGSETMAGFTLLEALVATALMGLILAAAPFDDWTVTTTICGTHCAGDF